MNITPEQKRLIEAVVSVFEGGAASGNYAAIATVDDGPNQTKQVSYGKHQATEFGALKPLLQLYVDRNGDYGSNIEQYIPVIKNGVLAHDNEFLNLLKRAAQDPIMRECQDEIFNKLYFDKAMKYADDHLFFKPLSFLVFYDSHIHGSPMASWLTNKFPERKPDMGGDEKIWIRQYVKTRRHWLKSAVNPALHATTYRMETMLKLIDDGNWDLVPPIYANGVKIV